jgi:penicillin-binding protein 2
MLFKRKKNNLNVEDILSDQVSVLDHAGDVSVSINKWGMYILIFVIFTFSIFFSYRAYSLQIVQYEDLKNKSLRNNFASVKIPSVRGSIIDSRGESLARTTKSSSTELYSRVYSDRLGLGNILGFVSYPKKDKSGNSWQDNFKGVEGAEDYYDQLLAGAPGEKLYEKSAEGYVGEGFIGVVPVNGKSVNLSIDAELQELIYKKLSKFLKKNNYEGGSAVIMDINTGEVLSLVSYPTYNPNLLMPDNLSTTTNRSDYYKSLENNKLKPFLNRPISGAYAPGSILKPLFALAALNEGFIDLNTSIFSSGQISVANPYTGKPTIFRDWKAHGWTNVKEAIAVSSDVFFYSVIGGYELQKGMGITKLSKYAKSFGIEDKTGIDLSGEKVGVVPTPDWKLKIFNEPWRLGDSYNSSIGQFGFTVTPIAMASIVGAIANSGYLLQPKILKSEVGLNSVIKKKVNVDIEEKWYKAVREGMRLTVTNGTARSLNMPFVEVAAKTGTAEIGSTKRNVNTWITGYFPYEKPRYSFVIIAEKGDRSNSPSPAMIMRETIEWMRIERPEYLGFSEAQIERMRIEKQNKEELENTSTSTVSEIDSGETASGGGER